MTPRSSVTSAAPLHRFIPLAAVAVLFAARCALSAPAPGGEAAEWHTLLSRGREQLDLNAAIIDAMARELPGVYPGVRQHLAGVELRFQRLMAIQLARHTTPFSIIDMREQVRSIEARIAGIASPLEKRKKALDAVEKFNFHIAEGMGVLREQGLAETTLPQAVASELGDFGRRNGEICARAASLNRELELRLQAADGLREKVNRFRDLVESKDDGVLRGYYLEAVPDLFSGDGWRAAWGTFRVWARTFTATCLAIDQSDDSIWARVAARAVVAALVLLFAARMALRRLEARVGVPGLARSLFPAIAWLAGGAALCIGVGMPGFIRSGLVFAAVWLLLIRGGISLGGRLENAASDARPAGRWLIMPLWAVAAAGNTLQALNLHIESISVLWCAALLPAWLWAAAIPAPPGSPVRPARQALLWFIPLLLLCALLGWVNIAVFAATVVLAVSASAVLAAGISAATEKIPPAADALSARHLALRIVRETVNYPNVLILSLFASLAGYLAYLGGGALLRAIFSVKMGWRHFSLHLVGVPMIVAGFFLTRSVVGVVSELIPAIRFRDEEAKEGDVLSLQALSRYLIWFVYAGAALTLAGFTMSNLALIAGGLSVGIGFGMQVIVNNFISGLILLLGREIQPGDMIERDGAFSRVERVTIRNTILKTYAGKTIIVPNSEFVSKSFANWTYLDPRVRAEVPVKVDGKADSRRVEELLLGVALANPRVLRAPHPTVRLENFGGGKLEFSLRVWLSNPADWKTVSELRHELDRALKADGIAIV
ncbi:MAG: mechanosensitive ion channel domain-containing protein [Chlamydiota bacterium]